MEAYFLGDRPWSEGLALVSWGESDLTVETWNLLQQANQRITRGWCTSFRGANFRLMPFPDAKVGAMPGIRGPSAKRPMCRHLLSAFRQAHTAQRGVPVVTLKSGLEVSSPETRALQSILATSRTPARSKSRMVSWSPPDSQSLTQSSLEDDLIPRMQLLKTATVYSQS